MSSQACPSVVEPSPARAADRRQAVFNSARNSREQSSGVPVSHGSEPTALITRGGAALTASTLRLTSTGLVAFPSRSYARVTM